MNIQQATVGNVSLVKISTGDGSEHLFLSSSDPLTRAFKVTVRTDQDGESFDVSVKTPGATGQAWYILNGQLQHITVEELQTVNTSAFSAVNGEIK